MTKVLIIVAHPDDEVLGCGGYISKFSKKKSFKIVFMAEGTSCRFTKINLGTKKVIKEINKRKKMAIKALNFLGVKNYKFYNYPCGRLDGVEIIDLNKIIEAEIKSYKPNIILTHNENDCNNDHRIIYRSVMMASRPTKKNNFVCGVFFLI